MILKTKDEVIRDLADQARDQSDALGAKMTAILSGIDEDGDEDLDRICGITRDKDGRSMLVFAEYGATTRRFVIYVDSILALAKMLNGEHMIEVET